MRVSALCSTPGVKGQLSSPALEPARPCLQELTPCEAIDYLRSKPRVAHIIGGDVDSSDHPSAWRIDRIDEGKINLVYAVHGPRGSVLVKQAPPYVRSIGESFPLPQVSNCLHY